MHRFESLADYLVALEDDPTLAILPIQTVADHLKRTRPAVDRMVRIGQLEEISIGKTRFVRAASLTARARDYIDKVAKVRRYLEDAARRGEIVTYGQVMALVGLQTRVPASRTLIGRILGDVARQTFAEQGVLLTVIVHRKSAGQSRPGPGFLPLADELGSEYDDAAAYIAAETQKVFAFHRTRIAAE